MREGRRFGPRPPTVLSTGPNENHKQREHQTMSRMMLSLAALAATTLAATPALAHAQDTGAMGFWAGLGHPFAGLDHLLAMVAVGLWASQLGGRALWAIPASFVAAMAAGASFALAEPRLVGEQNALGLGVWARCADSMRMPCSQISTPRLVVKPRSCKVCKTRARA